MVWATWAWQSTIIESPKISGFGQTARVDTQAGRGRAKVRQGDDGQGNALTAILSLGEMLLLARRVQAIDAGGTPAGVDLLDCPIDSRLERCHVLERGDPDRHDEVPILPGPRPALHVPELGPVARSREHRRENAHDHREPGALETADWKEQPVQRGRRIRRRPPVLVERPSLRQAKSALLVDSHFPVRRAAEGSVVDNGRLVAGWNRD